MARGWKRVAEIMAARSGLARVAETRSRPSTLILAYHNIVPEGEEAAGDRSLHVDQAVFADQLDFLLEGRVVVPLSSTFDDDRDRDRTRIVITFDDAYRGTMTAGVEELRKRGLPATVFVPPGLLGEPGFWWDRLAPASGGPLDPRIRRHALESLSGRAEPVLRWAKQEGLELLELPEHARPVTTGELAADTLPRGISLGAHTWSHPNLTALSTNEVGSELERSRAWLRTRTDAYVDWLAYPYGLRDARVVAASRDVFEGALLISGGAARRRGRVSRGKHEVPRLNVPRGLTLEGLALRLAGLLA